MKVAASHTIVVFAMPLLVTRREPSGLNATALYAPPASVDPTCSPVRTSNTTASGTVGADGQAAAVGAEGEGVHGAVDAQRRADGRAGAWVVQDHEIVIAAGCEELPVGAERDRVHGRRVPAE